MTITGDDAGNSVAEDPSRRRRQATGSFINYVKLGAKMHPLEWSLAYVLPCLLHLSVTSSVQSLLLRNAVCQVVLFVAVVIVPAYLTERMVYVDIGWPTGLVVIGANALLFGDGVSTTRRYLTGGLLVAHGGRMAFGAIVKFGRWSKWTYRFPEDLSRYRYAKHRWIHVDHMSERTWWIKIQHDCAQQGFANATLLALPVFASVCNPHHETLQPVEIAGWCLWFLSWAWENVADGQKIFFDAVQEIEKRKRRDEAERESDNADAPFPPKEEKPVLGYPPWNGRAFCLWTWCRHPNYLGELGCWIGVVLVGASSVPTVADAPLKIAHLVVLHLLLVRFLYDCLVWWTGAAPAEFYSTRSRPLYKDYQRDTPCFLPGALSLGGRLVNDHCVPGWPEPDDDVNVSAQ